VKYHQSILDFYNVPVSRSSKCYADGTPHLLNILFARVSHARSRLRLSSFNLSLLFLLLLLFATVPSSSPRPLSLAEFPPAVSVSDTGGSPELLVLLALFVPPPVVVVTVVPVFRCCCCCCCCCPILTGASSLNGIPSSRIWVIVGIPARTMSRGVWIPLFTKARARRLVIYWVMWGYLKLCGFPIRQSTIRSVTVLIVAVVTVVTMTIRFDLIWFDLNLYDAVVVNGVTLPFLQ
jgi:hypothetical protein